MGTYLPLKKWEFQCPLASDKTEIIYSPVVTLISNVLGHGKQASAFRDVAEIFIVWSFCNDIVIGARYASDDERMSARFFIAV